jgi:hypothetical protein
MEATDSVATTTTTTITANVRHCIQLLDSKKMAFQPSGRLVKKGSSHTALACCSFFPSEVETAPNAEEDIFN